MTGAQSPGDSSFANSGGSGKKTPIPRLSARRGILAESNGRSSRYSSSETSTISHGNEPGRLVWIITGAESLKGRLLNAARRFSLCAQTEEPPFYKYVSVEGPIVDVAPAELEADRRPLARRYFGPELGDAYVASTDGEGNLKFSMRPTRWWSVDYTKS